MRKVVIFLFLCFLFVAVKSQTTGSYWRVTTKYTLFNQPLPDSAIILEKDSAKFYQIVHIGGVLGTQNMAYAWSHGWVRRIPKDLLGYSIPGGGTVSLILQGYGIISTPNPLTTTGTIKVDSTVVASKLWVATYVGNRFALLGHTHSISDILHLGDSLKTYVPKTRTLTINGVSYTLNEDRTWTITFPKDSTYIKSGKGIRIDSIGNTYTVVNISEDSTYIKSGTGIRVDSVGNTYTITNIIPIPVDSTYIIAGNGIRIDSSGNTYTIVNISKDSTYIRAGTGISLVGSDSLHNTYTITNSSPSSGGTVTSISQGTGMLFSVNPLVTTGTIGIDTAKVMLFNDTLSAGKITTKKALIDGLALKRNLNNHDSLSTLDEKSYNSLSDKPTAWTIAQITNLSDSLKTYVPKGRTLSINGTSYNLNQNRTWTIALPKDSTYVKSGTWLTLAGSDSTHNSYTVSADTAKVVGFNDTLTAGKIATKKYVEDRKMVYPGAGIPISNGSAWSSSITDAHSNWDAGYTYRLTSATGTAPLTLTLGSNALTGSVAAFSTSTTSTGVVTGSNSLGPTYYLNGNNAWSIPPNTTYSAGYRIGLSSTTFNNLSYRKDIDTVKTTLTGFLKATAGVLSADNSTYLTTEVDGSTTNELQAISYANGKLTIGAGGGTPNTITLPKFSITDTARGLVPGSAAAAATNFLNASGAWSIPASATSYPGAGIPYSSGSAWSSSVDTIQYDTLQIQFVAPLSLSGSNVIVNTFSGSTAGVVPVSVGGTSNYLRADGAWATPGGGGSGMTWPGAAGITIYGGANAWGTSITDNHANWDNGYTYRVTSASGTAPLTLGLSSNALTGSMTQANTTTAGYLGSSDWNTFNGKRSLTNHDSLSTLDEKSYNSLTDRPTIPAAETTFGTVTSIATTAPITGGTITSSGTIGISAFAGSTPGAVPTSAGGTTNYLRADGNWAPPAGGSGMTWPSAGGIALCEGSSAWGTSITDNSSNWNTAYSWGPDLWTLNGSSIYRNSLVGVGISPLFNFHANMGSGRNIGFISDAGYAGTSGSAIVSVNNANNAYSPLSINASTLILQGSGGTGYVGIGTPPIRQLHSYSPTISNEFIMEVGDCAADHRKWNFIVTGGTGTNPNMYLRTLNDAGNATTQLAMEWQQDGKVGINTTTLTEMLTVNGNVSATKYLGSIEPLFGTAVDSTLVTTTIKFPIGYSQGFVVDTLIFIATTISTGTVNITPKLYYGIDVEAAGTAIITSPSAVTSHTAATKIYSFNNATVNKGNMVWLTFTNVTTKPRNFMLQIIGHRL